MRVWTTVLRSLALLALAVWVGGFTFYSAVVIPILHEAIGTVETGYVTQHVTDALNAVGLAAVVTCATWTSFDWRTGSRRGGRARVLLLFTSSVILIVQIALHRVMDRHLDRQGLPGFYPLHRIYLLASTTQWLANVALLLRFTLVRELRGTPETDGIPPP